VDGRRLVLGGVEVPSERGLAGHSDGDALVHAVVDALLGAAGLGDIGQHFPPSDPAYSGADSLGLLAEATRLVREAGWRPRNVDATVVCERPRLAPFLPAMRAGLARVLGVADRDVSVKAKTNEGLDAVGRGEAVAAQAIILIVADPRQSSADAGGAAGTRGTGQAGEAGQACGAGDSGDSGPPPKSSERRGRG
jgi:2-C-methyl-D-erythritol 2,4-cyclodiphosphate synthase